MNAWTAHLKPGRAPVLVKEAFSWGAFLFGPLWLLASGAWIPAALAIPLLAVELVLLPPFARVIVTFALMLLIGLLGRDLVRWSVERRGYVLCHVLAARDDETALGRLLTARPDLVPAVAGQLPGSPA